MSFVFPILLGGLGLLAVPILIHLILRQKPKTLKFPAFRFLMQRSKTNLRKLQLRHLLLLAMRMLLLALICFALARPKLSGNLLNLQTDSPVAIVLLFDTSYSMQYKTTGDQNRLEDARERAIALLETLHPDSRVLVLDTAESVSPGKSDWLSRDKALAQVNALALRYDNFPVTTRLADAYHLFSRLALTSNDEIGRRIPRVLCVFSDRTQASWEPQHLGNLLTLADNIPPPLERLYLIQGNILAKIALLQDLRQHLPPAGAQDYPEQSLISHWEELRQKISSTRWDNYPDSDWVKLLSETRGRSRDLLKQLQAQDAKSLADAAKEYRQKLMESLETGLWELQGVMPIYVDVGVKDARDLGIMAVDFLSPGNGSPDPRQVFSKTETIQVQVNVQATGSDFENSLICELNGKEHARLLVAVNKGESKPYVFQVNGENLQPGFHQLQFSLSAGDQLAFNNRRHATFMIRPPRQILIITDDVETARPLELIIRGNPKVQLQTTLRSSQALQNIGPAELAGYQAVYLLNVEEPTADLWKALKTYVDRGGNLAIIPGEEAKAYNDDEIAKSLLPGQFEGIEKAEARKIEKAEAGEIEKTEAGAAWNWKDETIYQHPFLKPFDYWRKLGTVDFLQVPRKAFYYWRVKPFENKESSVLVRYDVEGNHPALLERDFGKGRGRVVLLTTRLDYPQKKPEWNDYFKTDSSWFAVFPGELSVYLVGDLEKTKLNFITGRSVPAVTLPPGASGPGFTLRGPLPAELIPRPDSTNEILLRQAVTPGNYTLAGGNGEEAIGAFSVNLPPEEGSLNRVPLPEIETLFGKDAVRNLKQGDTLGEVMEGIWTTPEELFPILMVGLLVLLALENLLSNLFYRRERQPQESGGAL